MDYTKQDLLDYLCNEPQNQYVLFSTYLQENHPDFILTVDEEETDFKTIEEIARLEDRILIKQKSKTESELIYKIYQKKTNKLLKKTLDTELKTALLDITKREGIEEEKDEYEYFS